MRILLVTVDFIPHNDGVSTLSFNYARRLAELGHEVEVVAPRSEGQETVDRGTPYRVRRFSGYSLGPFRFIPFAVKVARSVRERRPDVVLTMNIGYGGVLSLFHPRMRRIPFVTMAYGLEFRKFRANPLLSALYRRIYKRSLFVVAVSRYTRNELLDMGAPAERVHVVYPGTFAPVQAPETGEPSPRLGHPVLGSCGRLIRRKGHDIVIRALPMVVPSNPDIKYVIAGRGPEQERLHSLVRSLGLDKHVKFLGEIPSRELPAFFKSLDVFVMPSRDDRRTGHVEGFGIVYLEAAVYGVPSIGTTTGGIPEAIVEGDTGRLVPDESPEALAAVLCDLLKRPDEMRRLGLNAKRRVEDEFLWNHQVDRFNGLLLSAAG